MDYFISIQLKRLKSPRADERIMGCDQLAAVSNLPPLAVNLLEEAALLDSDPQVRQAANRALQSHKLPGVGDVDEPTPSSADNQRGTTWLMTPTSAIGSADITNEASIVEKLKKIPPNYWVIALFIGIALFDWMFPAPWAKEMLEREYPKSVRWMVFFSYSEETQKGGQERSATRGYLLMPESFIKAKVLIISTINTPSFSSVDSSWDGLAFLFLIGGYGYAYVKLVRQAKMKKRTID